jgi:Uma2 family endonuclease
MATAVVSASVTSSERLPPPESGDRLTRDEFERRYAVMPEIVKAELIEGIVYVMSSPVSSAHHGPPHFNLITWLGFYSAMTPGVEGADNTTVRLDEDNEPQPDALLRIAPRHGGQSGDEDNYILGTPELAADVAASSASYDLHDKLRAYKRNGVKEYLVWRTWDGAVDWFLLCEGRYDRLTPDADGIQRSKVFPGLWLEAPALPAGSLARVFEVAEQGIQSPEHRQFVEQLAHQSVG